MYIMNKDELVPMLRMHLGDYLVQQGAAEPGQRKFKCFVHDDSDPSMQFDPKRDDEVVHCFSCHADLDIFGAAEALEGLPSDGPEWITHTIPTLAKRFEIPVVRGEPSPEQAARAQMYQIAQDVTDILLSPTHITEAYPKRRGWLNPDLHFGSIAEDDLMAKLVGRGWTAAQIRESMIVSAGSVHWFGPKLVTTPIRDFRGRPVGFVSRNINKTGPKYINSCETPIFKKGEQLLGLDSALKAAKHNGLYIVEGMGDLAQLRRLGIRNSVAVAGTAFTTDHLLLLKSLGIRSLYFCFDWDEAGVQATSRVFSEALRNAQGMNCCVVMPPESGENDPDEYLQGKDERDAFTKLETQSAFEWTVNSLPPDLAPADVCEKMIPIIAAEPLMVRRDVLIQQLSEHTGIHFQSIVTDVNSIRDNKFEERRDRLKAEGLRYVRALEDDPDNAPALFGVHEDNIRRIESDYERDIIGPGYQLGRFEAIESMKSPDDDNQRTSFRFGFFKNFEEAMSGGMQSTTGLLYYFGGRANSGKTATMIALGLDVAIHDDNTIVLYHFTDDSYDVVHSRIKTNVSMLLRGANERSLTIAEAENPYQEITSNEVWAMYNETNNKIRDLIQEERLVVIDSEDGANLSALERQLAYIRRHHPEKKILMVCDNTYNYQDFMAGGDQMRRMTMISNRQKELCTKYKAAMFATVEYRKNMPKKLEELKLPVDDDIADARALMYRANVIVHVYNDLHDRKDHAEAYWIDPFEPDVPKPRLQLIFSKNKVSGFKQSLAMDLDTKTVTVFPTDISQAVKDSEAHSTGKFRIQNGMLYSEAEDYYDEQEAK